MKGVYFLLYVRPHRSNCFMQTQDCTLVCNVNKAYYGLIYSTQLKVRTKQLRLLAFLIQS